MTIKATELRRQLNELGDELTDDMEVVLRIQDRDGFSTHLSNLDEVSVDAGCTDTEALILDGSQEEEPG